jgi:hypothetical protein
MTFRPGKARKRQPEQRTNVGTLTNIMTYGNPMKQIWIMECIMREAKRQAEAPVPNWPEGSFIHPEAWKRAACEVLAELKAAGYNPDA